MASPASVLLPVLHGFLSMVPSATLFGRLKDADPEWATTDGQQRLVRDVLRHPRAIKHPPENALTLRFLRLVVDGVEESGDGELDDDLMEILAESMARGGEELVPYHYRTFFLSDGTDVSLKLRSGFGAQATGGTGSALWEAGLFLCDLIARQPEKFAGRRVLELGAGNGLTGVVFARMTPPPAEVVLTDHTEPVLALMEHNLRLNGVAAAGGAGGAGGTAPDAAVRVQPLDWEVVAAEGPAAARGRLAALCGRVDVVVGADISFDPALIAASLGVLRAALEGGAALALLATTIRNPDTFTFLLAEAPRQGLDVTEVERHADGKPPALFAAYPEVISQGCDVRILHFALRPGGADA